MHCLDDFASWQIRSSKSCGALSLHLKLFDSALNVFPAVQKIWIGFRFNIKCFTTTSGKNESERIVTDDTYVYNCWKRAARIPQFLLKTTKPIQLQKTLRQLRVPFFVNKHSTDTRHRATAVTMHDGEQVTAIKNGKLARSPEQNSPTDMSECKFWRSTRFKSCTALKRSTKRLNKCRIWRWSLFVDTACFCGRTANQSRKVLLVALSNDHNLNDFKSILTLPPMWRELKNL